MDIFLRNIVVGLIVGASAGAVIGLVICVLGSSKLKRLEARVKLNGTGTAALRTLIGHGPRDSGMFDKAKE